MPLVLVLFKGYPFHMARINTLGEARIGGLRLIAVCHNPACRAERELDLASIIEFVGERHPLIPKLGATHYSEKLKCPKCRHRGAFVWPKHLNEPEPQMAGLSYLVNRWYGTTLMETVARAGSEVVANVVYNSCLTHYRGEHITLQQGIRVIRDSRLNVIDGGKQVASSGRST